MPEKVLISIIVLFYIKLNHFIELRTEICKFSEDRDHCNFNTQQVIS